MPFINSRSDHLGGETDKELAVESMFHFTSPFEYLFQETSLTTLEVRLDVFQEQKKDVVEVTLVEKGHHV